MIRHLYVRIYLAVLASVIVSVLLAGLAWRIFGDGERAPNHVIFREAAQTILPAAGADPGAVSAALQRWSVLTGYDLALLDAGGRPLAYAGGDRAQELASAPRRPQGGPFGPFVVALDDGRMLMAARSPPAGVPFRGFGFVMALILAAMAVALCAWPIVRRLTRGLEELERNVIAFGAGDLAARADVRGKDEVARLADAFNETAERVETLMRANRTLLANASHELRSPLARLRMSVETLSVEAPPRMRDELARNIRELDQLVDEILLASRLDAGAVEAPVGEEVDLVALAAEECARAGADLEARDAVEVIADPKLLRRALRNLIENATRYGANDIDVLVAAEGQGARVDVCDRGPGVPEADREKIFEPFYRIKGASEAAGGVGLGLSLARKIARLHGGSLVCLPRENGGACFRLTLPRAAKS
ncbi:MAG: HAMP domain-containing sensor histidine kinase [Beijerinckiaceae bacterium]|nr:HAMP domain-containing sensor histidine kinase [Beijerinckiaceae bacterium]